MTERLDEQLVQDEGEVLHLYYDERGVPTIGVGCNLRVGRIPDALAAQITITPEASRGLLALRVEEARRDLAMMLPWTAQLDAVRHAALVALVFNLGIGGLVGKNPRAVAACERGDFAEAASELLDGPWKYQVGHHDGERTPCRAHRLAQQLERGSWA